MVDDLAAEQASLDALVHGLAEGAWDTPTPAEGWSVRDQIAHLAFADELAAAALRGDGEARFRELMERRDDPDLLAMLARPGRQRTGEEVLAWWRTARAAEIAGFRRVEASARLPWAGNDMAAASLCTARLMETWAHGLDCFAALGVVPEDTDRLRHVCHLTYRAIPHAFGRAMLEMPGILDDLAVEVTAPSGEVWRYGPASASERITGAAAEFARVGVRRMRRADATTLHADGPLADAALDILQAYL